jgi:hypothetical protein
MVLFVIEGSLAFQDAMAAVDGWTWLAVIRNITTTSRWVDGAGWRLDRGRRARIEVAECCTVYAGATRRPRQVGTPSRVGRPLHAAVERYHHRQLFPSQCSLPRTGFSFSLHRENYLPLVREHPLPALHSAKISPIKPLSLPPREMGLQPS